MKLIFSTSIYKLAEISRSLDNSKIESIMSSSYHVEHNHEWAIGAKFVISGYDAQLVAQLAAQMAAQLVAHWL